MLKGVWTAIATPFDLKGGLDEEGFRQNLQWQIAAGVDGIIPLGTTGESPTLTLQEKQRIIEITLEEVNGRLPVYVGTGSYATQATIEMTRLAKAMGADGALIVTPYYNKPTQEGLYRHFSVVAEAADLPIIIYTNQSRTAQNMSVATLKRLSTDPRIVALKDSSGSIVQMMEIYESICSERKDFSLLSGDDVMTLPCLAIGGHGIVSVLSNLIPHPIISMVKSAGLGDWSNARKLHYLVLPLVRAAFLESNPIPLKSAMAHVGMPSGGCRLPLCEMQEENKVKLIETLEETIRQFPRDWQFAAPREALAR